MQNAIQIEPHAAENFVGFFGLRQALNFEIAHQYVFQRILILALIDMHVHRGLERFSGIKAFGTRQRQRRIAVDDRLVAMRVGEAAALTHKRDAKRVRGNIHQHAIDVAARQARGQHSGPERDTQVRVHILAGFNPYSLRQQVKDQRSAGGTAHQQHRVHVAGLTAGIAKGLRYAVERRFHQRTNEGLILLSRNLHIKMQWHAVRLGKRLLADVGVRFLAQFLLRFFGRPPQARLRRWVSIAEIDSVPLLKLLRQAFRQKIVEIVASQSIVAMAGEYFRDFPLHVHNGYVEGAAAKIVNECRMPGAIAKAISEAGRGGLIQNAYHFQARQRACFARGGSLRIREISGYRNDGAFGALAK